MTDWLDDEVDIFLTKVKSGVVQLFVLLLYFWKVRYIWSILNYNIYFLNYITFEMKHEDKPSLKLQFTYFCWSLKLVSLCLISFQEILISFLNNKL